MSVFVDTSAWYAAADRGDRSHRRATEVLAAAEGFRVTELPVNHRPRVHGRSKYGVWNRALPGLLDLLAVRWMFSRLTPVTSKPRHGGREQRQ